MNLLRLVTIFPCGEASLPHRYPEQDNSVEESTWGSRTFETALTSSIDCYSAGSAFYEQFEETYDAKYELTKEADCELDDQNKDNSISFYSIRLWCSAKSFLGPKRDPFAGDAGASSGVSALVRNFNSHAGYESA